MASVICFCNKEQWKYVGINLEYKVDFENSIGAVITKGNRIEGIEAKE